MEPGEGSAAPKATVALPGTDVNPAGRAPARLAVHCSLATGGPGAATPHAPFGRPRRPLGTFPRGESTSSARRRAKFPTRNRFLVEGKGKSLNFLFLFLRRFRLCGGDQRAFRSPFGNLRPPCLLRCLQAMHSEVSSSFSSVRLSPPGEVPRAGGKGSPQGVGCHGGGSFPGEITSCPPLPCGG